MRERSPVDMYHVMLRGNARQIIFEDDDDRVRFIHCVLAAKRRYDMKILAWCLMPNHVHLLVRLDYGNLSNAIQRIAMGYAQWFNWRHDRVGHVFQGRFKSKPIVDESNFIAVVRYIHENPKKARLTRSMDYAWSSLREFRDVSKKPIADRDFTLTLLGGFRAFEEIHDRDNDAIANMAPAYFAPYDLDPFEVAVSIVGEERLATLKSEPRESRDTALDALKAAGLSIRQVAMVTGIGRNIVQRAKS